MKLLFIQLRYESNMAVMCLSSFLKHKGYETDVIIIEGENNYVTKVKEQLRPDIIGFSAATVDIKRLLTINKTLKANFDFFSVFGGPHPTFFPELIEEGHPIDALCIGEGEYAMEELLDNLKNGRSIKHIENLYVIEDGRVEKNPLRPLIKDLDDLPFLDKHIYSAYYCNPYLLENVPIRFLSSRGCPYKCTYCMNHKYFELYGVTGNQVRRRTVDSIIREIKETRTNFSVPMVSFVDDIFCIPKKWVKRFAEEYSREVALPYSINTRPNTITEEIAALLQKSGCYYVTFSIESGDEFLRNNVLNRNIAYKDIVQAADILHKYKIRFCTGNMLGIPGETLETLKKTVKLNHRCSPHYAWASLFQPFPKLKLTEYAIQHGYFNGDFGAIGTDQFADSPLKMDNMRLIVRFHKFFALLVRYPQLLPMVSLLVRLPLDRCYNWLFNKYKIRLNLPVIRASKELLEKQSSESFLTATIYLFRNYFEDFCIWNKSILIQTVFKKKYEE